MRFAIAAFDRYQGVFEALVFAGWQPVKLFTMPTKNDIDSNRMVVAMAEKHRAAVQLSRITDKDLWGLRDEGCDALIVASYNWKVPDWTPYLKYAVNFHPSPLPEGRGAYPVFRAIRDQWKEWGIACHKLTPQMDRGDILTSEKFALALGETHESLDLKLQMAGKKLAMKTAQNFAQYWDRAVPQAEGSYWEKPGLKERVVDFNQPVEAVLRHIRAYGVTDSLAFIDNCWVVVKRAVGWTELHNVPCGKIAHLHNKSVVVAVADGYVGLQDVEPAARHVVDALKNG